MRLQREHVVDVAIGLLDAAGLDALTMRKLAAELGVQAGALYWHFASKQALLDAMADRFLEGLAADLPAGSWDEQLSEVAGGYAERSCLTATEPGSWPARTLPSRNTLVVGNTAVEILQAAGLAPDRAGWTAVAAMHYVLGHTIEEQAQIELVKRGAWEPKLVVDGIENKIAATAFAADPGERFRYGLELFLDGIGQQLALPSSAARGRGGAPRRLRQEQS